MEGAALWRVLRKRAFHLEMLRDPRFPAYRNSSGGTACQLHVVEQYSSACLFVSEPLYRLYSGEKNVHVRATNLVIPEHIVPSELGNVEHVS